MEENKNTTVECPPAAVLGGRSKHLCACYSSPCECFDASPRPVRLKRSEGKCADISSMSYEEKEKLIVRGKTDEDFSKLYMERHAKYQEHYRSLYPNSDTGLRCDEIADNMRISPDDVEIEKIMAIVRKHLKEEFVKKRESAIETKANEIADEVLESIKKDKENK